MIRCQMFSIFCLLSFLGCAEVEVPTPKDVITQPFGGTTQGMRGWIKEEVKLKWGEPDRITALEPDEWGAPREEWVYYGRYPEMPISYKYLSKTHYFYFTGNVLVEFNTEEKQEIEEPAQGEKPEKEK